MLAAVKKMAKHLTGATTRELGGLLTSRENRIRELETEIERRVGQRECRIRELEIEIRNVAEEARASGVLAMNRETRIRELESEIALVAERARLRIGELEHEIRRVAEEARTNLSDRERRVRELEEQVGSQNTFTSPWQTEASPEERALIAWQAAEGWCTKEKARWLAALVEQRRVGSALEVGVFGGKSFLPIAAAMTCRGGMAYGVEPWSNNVSTAAPTNIRNDLWWAGVDLQAVKSKFYAAVTKLGLASQVRMLEVSSDEARSVLAERRFDLIHIDGSHAAEQAMRDVTHYLPMLSATGVLVLDDVDWPSLADARAYVEERLDLLEICQEPEGSYAAYVKREG